MVVDDDSVVNLEARGDREIRVGNDADTDDDEVRGQGLTVGEDHLFDSPLPAKTLDQRAGANIDTLGPVDTVEKTSRPPARSPARARVPQPREQ